MLIRCLYFDRPRSLTQEGNTNVDSFFTTISQKDINAIKNAMQSYIDIFQYKEIESPTVLDGVINIFKLNWTKILQTKLLLIIYGHLEKMLM